MPIQEQLRRPLRADRESPESQGHSRETTGLSEDGSTAGLLASRSDPSKGAEPIEKAKSWVADPGSRSDPRRSYRRITTNSDEYESEHDIDDIMIGRHRRATIPFQTEEEEKPEFWTTTPWFKKFVAGIIMLNTIVIIIHAILIQMELSIFNHLDLAFTAFYVLELCCCLTEQGFRRYLCNDDWWNWFDLLITILCVVDLATVTAGTSTTRLLRLFRILRVCRGLRFLNEVDYVLVQIARATFKLALLVSMMLMISSMIATNLLWDCDDPIVSGMFQNLGLSLWTMFKIMTLDSWIEMVNTVLEVRPDMIWFFILFIFSTGISLMSLAPAMFIDISLKQNEHADFVEQERARLKLRRDKQRLLGALFRLTDLDNNGTISVDELKSVMTNDLVLQELQKRGISQAQDLEEIRLGLFDVFEENTYRNLEKDQSEISMEEFTDGILRMHEDLSQIKLWRSTTSTKLMLRDFAAVVLEELEQLNHTLNSSFEAGHSKLHTDFRTRWHMQEQPTLARSASSPTTRSPADEHGHPANDTAKTSPTRSDASTPNDVVTNASSSARSRRGSMQNLISARRASMRLSFERKLGLVDTAWGVSCSEPHDMDLNRKMMDRLANLDSDQDAAGSLRRSTSKIVRGAKLA